MSKTVDYFYTHSSPWTYLGSVRFHDIAKAAAATINYRPCDLGQIFPQSGGLPLPKRAPQRRAPAGWPTCGRCARRWSGKARARKAW